MEKTFFGLPIIHYIPYLQYSDKNKVHKVVDHKLVNF